MCTIELNGNSWLKAVRCGTSRLRADKEEINNLNVFPIPDGDTGDNMLMTIEAGCSACPDSSSISETASAMSRGALLGARGNSGVILSRIFSGLSKGLVNNVSCNVKVFSEAMESAVKEAYSSVSKPVEGTILTVLKDGVRVAANSGAENFEDYFTSLTKEMADSLERTPDLLAVLKEAGVVDSGGAGLLCIMEGIASSIKGESDAGETFPQEDETKRNSTVNLDAFSPESELKFGYCTEFLLRLQTSKVKLDNFDESVIRDYLESVGESVVCFREGSIVKVHVHSFKPGDILNHCQQWGEYLTMKIENMALQHNEKVNKKISRRIPLAVISVAAGEGMASLFKEAGADAIIKGGQTMNPPVQSFLDAFEKVNADHILVFPNNSNIILTAKQAADIYGKSDVRVINCKNQGAAYVAMAAIDRSVKDVEEILSGIGQVCDSVDCGMISRAIRSTIIQGKEIYEGDWLGISGGEIACGSSDRQEAAMELCGALGMEDRDVAIIFHGEDVAEEEAESLVQKIESKYPYTEIILKNGGQPVYDYIITLC